MLKLKEKTKENLSLARKAFLQMLKGGSPVLPKRKWQPPEK